MNQDTERTIDLKQLIFDYLKQWRVVVIAIVIGALLLSGYKAMKPAQAAVSESQLENLQTAVDEAESKRDALVDSKLEVQEQITANKQSITTKQDAIARMKKQIEAQNTEIEADTKILDRLEKLYDGASGESAAVLMPQIIDLHNQIQSIQNRIWSWEQEIANTETDIRALETANSGSLARSVTKLGKDIDKADRELKKAQEVLDAADGTTAAPVSTKKIILFALAGGVLGALVVAGWMFLAALLSHKLQNAAELTDAYRIPLLGSLYTSKNKHKTALDRALDRASGEPREVNAAMVCSQAAAKLAVQIPDGAQQIVLAGTVPADRLQTAAEALRAALPESWTLDTAANALHDPESTERLKNASVVLAEAKRGSDTRDIDALMKLLTISHSQVLGVMEL